MTGLHVQWLRLRGFTLVEVMIALAIVAVLAALALPMYQGYAGRARVAEGLALAAEAKLAVATRVADEGLANVAAAFNAQLGGAGVASKYVQSMQVDAATGMITITFDETAVGGLTAATRTLTLTPYVTQGGAVTPLADALAAGTTGPIGWGCASASSIVAESQGLAPVARGTLPANYAPNECR